MQSYTRILIAALTLAIIVVSGIPALTSAQDVEAVPKGAEAKDTCQRFVNLSEKIDQRMTQRDANLQAKRDEIIVKIQERRDGRAEKLADKRVKWDANRQEHFAKLREKAITDEQKQAVEKFISAVEAVITTRRQTVDAALTTFRTKLDQAKTSRQSAIDEALSIFRTAVVEAVKKALTDCQSGIEVKTVRQTLRESLKTARETLSADRQAITNLKDTVEPLNTAKKEAVKKAIDEFKTAVEQAKTELKAAFAAPSEPAETGAD